jgi:uncharacterized protein YggT (Ycf19 family)
MLTLLGQVANFVLALFIWLIVGRLVLDALVGHRRNLIADLFRRATDPIYALVRRALPGRVSDRWVPVLSILTLLLLRILLLPLLRTPG